MQKGKYVTATLSLFAAFAIGHFMQNGGATAARVESDAAKPAPVESMTAENFSAPVIASSVPFLVPEPFGPAHSTLAALHTGGDVTIQLTDESHDPFSITCSTDLDITPLDSGFVQLALAAPCLPNEAVEISHLGLEFTIHTDDLGSAKVVVPALASRATFKAQFRSGLVENAAIDLASDAHPSRFVVQWSGRTGLALHAFEGGAKFGDPGHVWSSGQALSEMSGQLEGHLSILGDDPSATRALVYSYPTQSALSGKNIALMVEAEILPETCGGEITGRMLEAGANGVLHQELFTVNVPECDTVGGFIQLKNFATEPKLAQN
ncbi:hypothetical protein [Celeribacter arenosi]|uniref:Translocase n=1 Tax=Celeribacter arenosi TaxID=792649 RepID=A0ABP7JYM4_9RHOB